MMTGAPLRWELHEHTPHPQLREAEKHRPSQQCFSFATLTTLFTSFTIILSINSLDEKKNKEKVTPFTKHKMFSAPSII